MDGKNKTVSSSGVARKCLWGEGGQPTKENI